MRKLSNTNWLAFSLLLSSTFYFLLLLIYKKEGTFTKDSRIFPIFDFKRVEKHSERSNDYYNSLKRKLEREIKGFKRDFPKLWRSGGHVDHRDKVELLERWTKRLASSKYLKYAKPKKILVFDGLENYYKTEGRLNCPFLGAKQAQLLQEKCLIKEDRGFDVINYLGYDTLVHIRNWKLVVFEQKISSVKHAYYIQESPFVTKYADFSVNNAILTSYWSGSDIVLPYGYFQKTNFSDDKENVTPGRNYAKGKSKLAAIIVSNCNAKNDRLGYVKELGKYIPVSVYGKCSTMKCNNCLDLMKQYKFYLAFENSNCRDYITEKFWTNAFESDAVPVVLGAHPEDYRAVAPPNSYIHVEDFPSPKDLAAYLTLLDTNDILYNEYFAYKQWGGVGHVWDQFFCRLCSMLHFADIVPPPVWKPGSEWGTVNKCLPNNRWFWGRN